MKQTEKQIHKDILQLFFDLETATYGRERTNGHYLCPNASSFFKSAKRIYELTDELYENYHPDYISKTDYKFICDSRKRLLLMLDVLKDNKHTNDTVMTYKLEEYLLQLQGLFKGVIDDDCN